MFWALCSFFGDTLRAQISVPFAYLMQERLLMVLVGWPWPHQGDVLSCVLFDVELCVKQRL